MHTQWTDQLSAYLDQELSTEDRAALEAHLEGCVECRQVLQELQVLVLAAPTYRGIDPAPAVWDQIAAGIEANRTLSFPARPVRRFSLGQLVAAAAVVATLAAAGVWSAMRPGTPAVGLAGADPEDAAVAVPASVLGEDPAYDAAVQELEATLQAGRTVLDTATVRVIEDNLRIIDAAIAEARAAIAADPSNAYLGGRVQLHMQRKLVLLRQAVRAAGAET